MKNLNTFKRSGNEDGITPAELIVPAAIGVGVAIACAVVLIFIVGAIVYSTSDPNSLVTASSLVILAISSVLAGFTASKKGGSFLPGLIAGTALMLIVFAASLISGGHGAIEAPYSYLARFGGFLLSLLGAFVATRSGGNKKFSSSPRVPKIKKR